MSIGPQKVRKAAEAVEESAQQLIAQAECVLIGDTEWARASVRVDLLRYAREYAAAVNRLTRVRK